MEQSKYIIVYIRLCPDLDYSTFYKTVVFQTVPPLWDLILQIAFDYILRVGVTVCLSGPTKTSSVQPYLRGTDWCRKSTTPWIYQGELRLCGHTGILNSYQKDEAPKLIRNQIKEMVQYPPPPFWTLWKGRHLPHWWQWPPTYLSSDIQYVPKNR